MKKYLLSFLIMLSLLVVNLSFVSAFDVGSTGLPATGDAAQFQTATDLPKTVGNVINGVLALLGLVLMIIVIYGGILYMLAGDDSKNITKAKAYITNGIVGVIIIGLAYAISTQVMLIIAKSQT